MAPTSAFLSTNKKRRRFSIFLLLISFFPLTSFMPTLFPFGIKKVVIDAGHGGHDPGCLGASSKEKEIALGISLKLGKYIEENLKDVEVIYTRKTDKFVELHERASIANRNKADLFICIHCNSGASPTAYGAETYVMGLHRTKENLAVAKRENSAILMEKDYEKEYGGFDPKSDEANIMFALYQSAFLDNSLNFASKVQKQFREKVGRYDRGVKQAGFLVLYMTTMPSVLIETGFLTNKNDEAFLRTENGQDLMAAAIYRAFKEYKYEIEGKKIVEDNPAVKLVNEKNDLPEKKTEPEAPVNFTEGIVFKVQFATSTTPVKLTPQNFKGLTDVESQEVNGLYRFYYGEERNIDGAKKLIETVKEKGYKDAFIVAFKNGERIPVSEAVRELNQ
jgi:N-acetylmuramoyl-L-alanine amidase